MKFLRIQFRSIGPFENLVLDLTGSSEFHVIFGPNEAGKSSALRGINSLLFGFPAQSGDDFRFKYAQFRIGATLQDSSGQTLECVRRKGRKGTLQTVDERGEIPETTLTRFLGGLNQQQFEQLFGLDTERLIAGGRDIAAGEGDLGEALFAAGTGLAGIRALAVSLEERQLALYNSRGQNQPINKALSNFQKQVESARNQILPPETYAAAERAVIAEKDEAEKLRSDRSRARAQLMLLQRYQAALPTIELLDQARKRLAIVADAPFLGPDFEAKWISTYEERKIAEAKLDAQNANRQALERQLRDEPPDSRVLEVETEIDELKKLVGADQKQQAEALKADTRRREDEAKARDIFRELTGTTAWEQMDHLKVRRDHEQRIIELANEQSAVLENLTNLERALEVARGELAIATLERANISLPPDPTPWLGAIEAIAGLGPVEKSAEALRDDVARKERELAAEYATFHPAAPGSWSDAPAIAMMSPEKANWFEREGAKANRELESLSIERNRVRDDLEAVRAQLAEVTSAELPPTLDAMTSARQDRDGGLSLVRRRLEGSADPTAEQAFTLRHARGRSLMDGAESAVRQCDELADRLRRDADRVALWQTLYHKRELLTERSGALDRAHDDAESVIAAIDQEWHEAWKSSGIVPEAPELMLSWLTRWHRFCDDVTACKAAGAQCSEDERRIAQLRVQLAAACPLTKLTKSLVEGLAVARQASRDALDQQSHVAKLDDTIVRLAAAVETAERNVKKAEERRDRWIAQWAAAITPLGLEDSSASVETAQSYLKSIELMQGHLSNARIKAARVREIATDRVAILERITALRRRLDPAARPTTDDSLEADFRQVDAAVAAARVQRTRHQECIKSFNALVTDIKKLTDFQLAAAATLAALAEQCGVADAEQIAEALRRSKERSLCAREVRDQEAALAKNAAGQALEAFIAAALEHADSLGERIESLEVDTQRLDHVIAAAEARVLKAEQVLEEYRLASNAAADARQSAELIAGSLEENVLEYAALHVARAALDLATERYRARHQDSLLSRASEFFDTLTCHAFAGLEIERKDEEDMLVAVRGWDRTIPRLSINGLSDGTRDQLFLALRLAGIEQLLADREPVPLIIDDVLMSFDDVRARATLRCLNGFATKTQVLLFTHHRHVVDLAVQINPQVIVHELVPFGRS